MSFKIDRIECFQIRWPMPEPLANSISVFRERATLLVAVWADGVMGWGECWAEPEASQTIIANNLVHAVLHADPTAPRVIWTRMMERLGRDRSGITHMAASALDMAVWDLNARLANVSLAKMLGGPVTKVLPTYASGPFLKVGDDPYRDIVREIESYLERGFEAVKLRLGHSLKKDIETMEAIRTSFDPQLRVMVDYNQGLSLIDALKAIRELDGFGVQFIEEPLQADDLDGYRELSETSPIPIAAGESLAGIRRFKDFVSCGAINIAQPDVAHCGGVTEYLRILALGEAFDIPVVPHVWSSIVVHATSLQLAALSPSRRAFDMPFPIFEIDPTPNALLDICGPIKINPHGHIAVPDSPGIGIELSEKILAPFTAKHTVL
ncbi:mandelate racemase/muconate lactonizing enzyme family protein [Brucella pseudogrignonensis]|uniref:mandelate racemase/muconate lactonizing enzyme family protein n=1 Tax=Brucella pseudogrignonensis TaxID=419475 RepID=UPI003D99F6B6